MRNVVRGRRCRQCAAAGVARLLPARERAQLDLVRRLLCRGFESRLLRRGRAGGKCLVHCTRLHGLPASRVLLRDVATARRRAGRGVCAIWGAFVVVSATIHAAGCRMCFVHLSRLF